MSIQRLCKRRCNLQGWDTVTRNILRVGSRAAEHLPPAARFFVAVGMDVSRVEVKCSFLFAGVGPLRVAGLLLRAEADDRLPVGVALALRGGDMACGGGSFDCRERKQRR